MTSEGPATQNYGAVFTRRWVVEVLLDWAYDLQARHVEDCRTLCQDLLLAAGESAAAAAALAVRWVRRADFLFSDLFSEVEDRQADVVVGNPPYVRYDDLAPDMAARYRSTWTTMTGRGDIYIGFIERSLRMLKPGGKVGFICADRWMRNAYGAGLRELVAQRYAVEHVWMMHDVDAFETRVSAYPAITVLANHAQSSVVVADTTAAFTASSAAELVRAVQAGGFTGFSGTGVTAHALPHWFDGGELWPTGSPARLALIEALNDRFGPLDDLTTGTKVSIGVASGADKVFVTKNPGGRAGPDATAGDAPGPDVRNVPVAGQLLGQPLGRRRLAGPACGLPDDGRLLFEAPGDPEPPCRQGGAGVLVSHD